MSVSDNSAALPGPEMARRCEIFQFDNDLVETLWGWVEQSDQVDWIPPTPVLALGLLLQRDPFLPHFKEEYRPPAGAASFGESQRSAVQMVVLRQELESLAASSFLDKDRHIKPYYFHCLGGLVVNGLAVEMAARHGLLLPDSTPEPRNDEAPPGLLSVACIESCLTENVHPDLPAFFLELAWKFSGDRARATEDIFGSAHRATLNLICALEVNELEAELRQ